MRKPHASRRTLPLAQRRLFSTLLLSDLCSSAYADGRFNPQNSVSRAQVASLLAKATGLQH